VESIPSQSSDAGPSPVAGTKSARDYLYEADELIFVALRTNYGPDSLKRWHDAVERAQELLDMAKDVKR
jgi:hypothetical protein